MSRAFRNSTHGTGLPASASGLTGLDQSGGNFSFGCWVKQTRSNSNTIWRHCRNDSTNGILANVNADGSIGLSVRDASFASYSTARPWVHRAWVHIGMTIDGSIARAYVNGVLIDAVAFTKVPGSGGTRITEFGIGSAQNLSNDLWDMRVFPNVALTHGEMRMLPNPRSVIPGCKQRLFWQQNFRMVGTGAVTIVDESGNGNNMTTSATTLLADITSPPNWRDILYGQYQPRARAFSGVSYDIVADAGSFALAGQAAAVRWDSVVPANNGAIAVGGQAASLTTNKILAAGAGAFTLSGQASAMGVGRIVAGAVGSFALAGQVAGLTMHHKIAAAAAAFALTGQDAQFNVGPVVIGPILFLKLLGIADTRTQVGPATYGMETQVVPTADWSTDVQDIETFTGY